ncbi:MAG: hypothetical protein NTZ59_14925 [Bacteroidetes bacterium]|jgi:hypothetical protein|nr:hypothetical protein [Bacteroidota bacterium]
MMQKDIDILFKSVKQVDAPPFLYTRISQKIANTKSNNLTIQFKVGFVVAAFVLLIVNVIAFNQFSLNNKQQQETVNTSYTTVTNNIYND